MGVQVLFQRKFFGGKPSLYAAGISKGQHAFRDVLCHDAPRADHGIASNGDAGKNFGSGTDPDIVPDDNGAGVLNAEIAQGDLQRMPGGIESAIRRKEDIFAEFYLCSVKDYQIVIGKEVLSDFNIVSIVAPKW